MSGNAFDISGPSLIAKQLGNIKGGLTRGQVASRAVHEKEKREGNSPGTIIGLSKKADHQILPRKGWGKDKRP